MKFFFEGWQFTAPVSACREKATLRGKIPIQEGTLRARFIILDESRQGASVTGTISTVTFSSPPSPGSGDRSDTIGQLTRRLEALCNGLAAEGKRRNRAPGVSSQWWAGGEHASARPAASPARSPSDNAEGLRSLTQRIEALREELIAADLRRQNAAAAEWWAGAPPSAANGAGKGDSCERISKVTARVQAHRRGRFGRAPEAIERWGTTTHDQNAGAFSLVLVVLTFFIFTLLVLFSSDWDRVVNKVWQSR